MNLDDSMPLVGIPACRINDEGRKIHRVGEKYIHAVYDVSECAAVLVPAMGDRHDFKTLIDRLDGILLTGGASNVEPEHYEGHPSRRGTLHDASRDNTTLPLIRQAVAADVPIFAVCRGIQELNVALGGTLHQLVHELPGKSDHRMDRRLPASERFVPRHKIDITPGGVLQTVMGGATREIVNSAHAQAIDKPAEGLMIEAVSEDGVIEGVSVIGSKTFSLGVQWHPEHPLAIETPLSIALFQAFGTACRARERARRDATEQTRAA
jgi:putative glutamine amidotransferase